MLETRRLKLRQLLISDHESLDALFGDADVMEFSDMPLNSDEAGAWLRSQIDGYEKNNGIEISAVVKKSTSEFIGYCGLTLFPDIDGIAEIEIGYRLIRKFRGDGFATEAASAVRDYAFSELKLTRLVALIEPSNRRSIRVAEKIGMTYEKDVMLKHYDHPDHLYSLHLWPFALLTLVFVSIGPLLYLVLNTGTENIGVCEGSGA